MKRFTLICILYIVPAIGFTQDLVPTISSANDGSWDNPSTWSNNRVPGVGDIVEINGWVYVKNNTTISGLVINQNGHLLGSNYKKKTLTVTGQIDNRGKIDSYPYIKVSGGIINEGTWLTKKITLNPNGNFNFSGKPIDPNSYVYLDNDAHLTGNVSIGGVFLPQGYTIYSDGTLNLHVQEVQAYDSLNIEGGASVHIDKSNGLLFDGPVSHLVLGQYVQVSSYLKAKDINIVDGVASVRRGSSSWTADTITIASSSILQGGIDPWSINLHLHGHVINYGEVSSLMKVYIYQDVDNYGTWGDRVYVDPPQGSQVVISKYKNALSTSRFEEVSDRVWIGDLIQKNEASYLTYLDDSHWSPVQTINGFGKDKKIYQSPKREFFKIDLVRDHDLAESLGLNISTPTDSDFSGTINLSATHGKIYPRNIEVKNGEWQGNVQLFDALENQQIHVQGIESYTAHSGRSNYFVTKEPVSEPGIVQGIVRDHEATRLPGQVVNFYNLRGKQHTSITDADGEYSASLPAGEYSVITDDRVTSTSVAPAKTTTHNIAKNTPCEPSDKIPVLLVPGIMGSDRVSNDQWFPELKSYLPNWDSHELEIHDPLGSTGFNDLTGALENEGYQKNCTIFHVPYDWSISVVDSAQQYLKPWIDHAKNVSGEEQVDIVAHSMGGLVSRAYIQGDDYEFDVRKLAMAGTPNAGSTQAYFIWEGGDPMSADRYAPESSLANFAQADQFYTNTIHRNAIIKNNNNLDCKFHQGNTPTVQDDSLLDFFFGENDIYGCDRNAVKSFLYDFAPSVGELFPTYQFLYSDRDNPIEPKFENSLLRSLNQQSCGDSFSCSNYTQLEDQISETNIGLFIGQELSIHNHPLNNTIEHVTVSPTNNIWLYRDGDIVGVTKNWGDGTVLIDSVKKVISSENNHVNSEHASLIKQGGFNIIKFLTSINK